MIWIQKIADRVFVLLTLKMKQLFDWQKWVYSGIAEKSREIG